VAKGEKRIAEQAVHGHLMAKTKAQRRISNNFNILEGIGGSRWDPLTRLVSIRRFFIL
jgi:hypothetical protein